MNTVQKTPEELRREKDNAYQREYKRKKRAAGDRRYFSTHEQTLVGMARQRAKKRGLPCDITSKDIVVPKTCPILGIELHRSVGHGQCENSPTLDCRDVSKGYVKGNVFVISNRANRIKSDATLAELEAIVSYMKGV